MNRKPPNDARVKPYLCKQCEETDPSKFRTSIKYGILKFEKSTCRACANKHRHESGQVEQSNRVTTDKRYGLKSGEYKAMFASQNGLCAICGKPESRKSKRGKLYNLQIDHNHETGEIRALLCHDCNVALGYLYEEADTAYNLFLYIKRKCQ